MGLARIFASALLGLALLTPALGRADDYPWHETVNLNNEANACKAIQKAFRRLNDGTRNPSYIRITGIAEVNMADIRRHQYKNLTTGAIHDAPFDHCFVEMPSQLYDDEGIYPIADGTGNSNTHRGHIFWDNVDLTFRCSEGGTQTRPIAIWQRGDGWLAGRQSGSESSYSGTHPVGTSTSGKLTIRRTGECDSIAPGIMVARDADTLFDQQTVTVGIWNNGVQRVNAQNLDYEFAGQEDDNDDIGFLFYGGLNGGSTWGRMRITKTGIGMMLSGPVITDFNGGYIESNEFGVVIGDPVNAADYISATTCVAGTAPSPGDCGVYGGMSSDARFNDITIEGNNYGEVVMYEGGTGVQFRGVHVESASTMNGHAFLIGAGTCSGGTRDGYVGGSADDCLGGGSLVCAGVARSFGITRFIGGYIPGDKGWVGDASNPDWGGLMIGTCANDSSSKVVTSGELVGSTIAGPTSVAFQFSPTLSMPNVPQVDVTNALRTSGFYWPAYPNLFHNGALSLPFMVNAAAWTSGEYISWGGDVTAGVASTDIFASVPVPYADLVDYQVHHLDVGTFAAHTGNQTCNFVPVIMDYDHANTDDIVGTTAALTGNPIAAGQILTVNYTPDASLVMNKSDANGHDKIGLRVENGSGCDELFASGVLTILPLE